MDKPIEVIPGILVIVGLGNPGTRYSKTRHNIGFRVLDALAQDWQTTFSHVARWQSDCASSQGKWLVKPLTFMNRSGEAVARILRYYRFSPAQLLVVVDDTALPIGNLRFRLKGSAGGHNGLRSLIKHLGTEDFPRLRMGIGSPKEEPLEQFVLSEFTSAEEEVICSSITLAVKGVEHACQNGMKSAMNNYNKTTTTL